VNLSSVKLQITMYFRYRRLIKSVFNLQTMIAPFWTWTSIWNGWTMRLSVKVCV